jgi:hypothetical protein
LSADEIWKTALHEGGHGYMAWRTGRRVGAVTVVPRGQSAGATDCGSLRMRWREFDRLDRSAPVASWPASIRRLYDIVAMCTAAGQLAEDLFFWPGRTGRTGDPVIMRATELAEATVAETPPAAAPRNAGRPAELRPTRAEAAKLAAADTQSDAAALAWWAADMFPGQMGRQMAWLGHIEAETRACLSTAEGPVLRLARALREYGTLSGNAVRAVLDADR